MRRRRPHLLRHYDTYHTMTFAFITVSVLTIICSFLLLSRVLRDRRLRSSAPGMTGLAGRTIVTAILISHLGLLAWPELSRMWWFTSDLGLAFGLWLLYSSFYEHYRRVPMSSGVDLQVPEDHYEDVGGGSGIRARTYTLGDPPVFSFERPLIAWLEQHRAELPDRATIVFHQARQGAAYGDATKPVAEWLYVLRGRARITDEVVVSSGEDLRIRPTWEHYYTAEEHTIGCTVVWPD